MMLQALVFAALFAAQARLGEARTVPSLDVTALACCDNPLRVCCDGSCFPPGTAFFAPCESNSCGCPDETPPSPPPDGCCPRGKACCGDRCIPREDLALTLCFAGPGCCDDDEDDEDEKCCTEEERVCCDGQCFPPGTQLRRLCTDTEDCGCPGDPPPPPDDCCPPDHYCCFSSCTHNSIVHVWCGPPDAPTCCDVAEGGGDASLVA